MEVKVYPQTIIGFCWLCYVIALEMLPVLKRDDLKHNHKNIYTCEIIHQKQICSHLNLNKNKVIF